MLKSTSPLNNINSITVQLSKSPCIKRAVNCTEDYCNTEREGVLQKNKKTISLFWSDLAQIDLFG